MPPKGRREVKALVFKFNVLRLISVVNIWLDDK